MIVGNARDMKVFTHKKDETGYKEGENQKRKIVETEVFSVDERIKIISEIFAITEKEGKEST